MEEIKAVHSTYEVSINICYCYYACYQAAYKFIVERQNFPIKGKYKYIIG